MPVHRQDWAAVIKLYYVIVTVSLDLQMPRAHCVGCSAHMMSEIERAGRAISAPGMKYCRRMW